MSSPLFNDKTFTGMPALARSDSMTVQGAINKSAILLFLVIATSVFSYSRPFSPGLFYGGLIGGLVVGIVIGFKPAWSPALAPAYALLEGLALGGLSALVNRAYGGIVMQALLLTFGIFAGMLGLYSFRIIQATQKFRAVIGGATLGIFILYMVAWVLRLCHVPVPFLDGNGWFSIGLSVVISLVAAFNLIIDFDNIETGAAASAPRYMEWYCGFGLLVTLVWLYVEILRLLMKLRSDD